MDDFLIDGSGSARLEFWTSSNRNFTSCAAETLEDVNHTPYPSPVIYTSRIILALYVSVELIFGFILNSFVLFLIMKYKKLQTRSFAIAFQIILADSIISIAYGLPLVGNNIAGSWALGVELCLLSAFIGFLVLNLRMFLICTFSFDLFASVFVPFLYPKYSRKIVITMCILSWSISTLLCLLMIPPMLDCYIYSQPSLTCSYSSRCNETCRRGFYVYLISIVFPAITIPIGFFIAMYIKGRRIRRNQAKLQASPHSQVSDWRAIKTFSLLFMATFLVTMTPILVIQISKLLHGMVHILLLSHNAGISLALLIIDPIMILRNGDVKEVLLEVKQYWEKASRHASNGRLFRTFNT